MTKPITEAHVRRSDDVSHGRQPLRLEIGRRRARTRSGREKFVTEVRFHDDTTAVVVPWSAERRVSPESVLVPRPRPDVETIAA
jgi:hypothetical protein